MRFIVRFFAFAFVAPVAAIATSPVHISSHTIRMVRAAQAPTRQLAAWSDGMVRAAWSDGMVRAVQTPTRQLIAWSDDASPRDVTVAGAATNVVLSGLKAGVGVAINSASLIADAAHSLSDLLSDGLALCAASSPSMEEHCTRGIALMLGCTGLTMVYHSGAGLLATILMSRPAAAATAAPVLMEAAGPAAATAIEVAGLCVALLSIASKEALFRVTHRVGTRVRSSTLVANAFHHRSDAMSSVAAACGICGALVGFRALDSLAALVVGGMVVRLGVDTARGVH